LGASGYADRALRGFRHGKYKKHATHVFYFWRDRFAPPVELDLCKTVARRVAVRQTTRAGSGANPLRTNRMRLPPKGLVFCS
jgi:hypothetical protein